MRWPEGPPHLALNPLPFLFSLSVLFILVFFCFSFLSLVLIGKLFFPYKRGFMFIFESPFVSP